MQARARTVWIVCTLGLLVCVAPAAAQVPAVPAAPGIPGAPPAPGVPVAPVAAPAQPQTLWNFLGITPANCQKCKDRFCGSPFGQLVNNMMLPMQFASGGLIQPCCPTTPSAADLAKLTDPNNLAVSPAEAVAAKIKADEATVKARIAALRYLSTVDCHYYPEAGDAIIEALRKDRNECVRFEAALALTHGCCCNKKTIAALILVVTGKDTDGNPSETSGRVKAMAASALNLCMGHVPYFPDEPTRPEVPPEPGPVPPELPPDVAQAGFSRVKLTAYYTQYIPQVPGDKLIQQAGRVLAELAGSSAPAAANGGGGLLQVWQDSRPTGTLREVIPFDEAALATPPRPIKANSSEQKPKASLGFTGGSNSPPPPPEKAPLQSGASSLSPVAWPLKGDGAVTFAASSAPTSLANAAPTNPVPWPLTGSEVVRAAPSGTGLPVTGLARSTTFGSCTPSASAVYLPVNLSQMECVSKDPSGEPKLPNPMPGAPPFAACPTASLPAANQPVAQFDAGPDCSTGCDRPAAGSGIAPVGFQAPSNIAFPRSGSCP